MKSKWTIYLLAALSAAAGILMTMGCPHESNDYYINGTIGSNTYNNSGYVFADVADGQTTLLAADSLSDWLSSKERWLIYFPATTAGTYTYESGAIVFFLVSSSEMYTSSSDISIVVSTYTSSEIAGTFSGTLIYSVDSQGYAAMGEFRVRIY